MTWLLPSATRRAPFSTAVAGVVPLGPPVPKTLRTWPVLATAPVPRLTDVSRSAINGSTLELSNLAPFRTRTMTSVDVMFALLALSKDPAIDTVAAASAVPGLVDAMMSSTLPRTFVFEIGSRPPTAIPWP